MPDDDLTPPATFPSDLRPARPRRPAVPEAVEEQDEAEDADAEAREEALAEREAALRQAEESARQAAAAAQAAAEAARAREDAARQAEEGARAAQREEAERQAAKRAAAAKKAAATRARKTAEVKAAALATAAQAKAAAGAKAAAATTATKVAKAPAPPVKAALKAPAKPAAAAKAPAKAAAKAPAKPAAAAQAPATGPAKAAGPAAAPPAAGRTRTLAEVLHAEPVAEAPATLPTPPVKAPAARPNVLLRLLAALSVLLISAALGLGAAALVASGEQTWRSQVPVQLEAGPGGALDSAQDQYRLLAPSLTGDATATSGVRAGDVRGTVTAVRAGADGLLVRGEAAGGAEAKALADAASVLLVGRVANDAGPISARVDGPAQDATRVTPSQTRVVAVGAGVGGGALVLLSGLALLGRRRQD